MFMTPSKSLAPWLLRLEQEPYVLYINLNCTSLGYKIYTTTLKNHLQKNLRCNYWWKPISCYQKQDNITHIFHDSRCNWCPIKVKSCFNIFGFSWTFYRVDWVSCPLVNLLCHKFVLPKFILPFLSLVMKTNSSTWLKLRTPISNLKLK